LVPLVQRELRRTAAAYLHRERADHTLQPTALVNEVYVRLMGGERVAWQNRTHFFRLAARIMRRILIDRAREHAAAKRPGASLKVELRDDIGTAQQPDLCDLLSLDQALTDLGRLDPQQAEIVELRYFGGLQVNEIAEMLGLSESTVKREWNVAKAWLYAELSGTNHDADAVGTG